MQWQGHLHGLHAASEDSCKAQEKVIFGASPSPKIRLDLIKGLDLLLLLRLSELVAEVSGMPLASSQSVFCLSISGTDVDGNSLSHIPSVRVWYKTKPKKRKATDAIKATPPPLLEEKRPEQQQEEKVNTTAAANE